MYHCLWLSTLVRVTGFLIVGLDKNFPKKMEGSRDVRRLAERSPAERQGLGRQSK